MKHLIRKILLERPTYEDIMSIMGAKKNDVKTLGIITAWNPKTTKTDQSTNLKNQAYLKRELRNRGYNFIDISGVFNYYEEGLLVINISKSELIELGSPEWFNQTSVIFGRKVGRKFVFDYIEGDTTVERKDAVLGKEHELMVTADDLYSLIKGKKFNIPFFKEGFDYPEKSFEQDIFKSKNLTDYSKIKEYYDKIMFKMLKNVYNKYDYEEFKPIVNYIVKRLGPIRKEIEKNKLKKRGMPEQNIELIFGS